MMMMKFMFNVAAISWMMSDSMMGLVLVYNALGLITACTVVQAVV